MPRKLLIAACSCVGFCASAIRAESIFDRHDRRAAYLFVDNRGRRVGDNVTVIIRETTGIDQREQRALDKKTDAGGELSFATAFQDGANTQAASGSIEADASSNRSFDGQANFTSQRDMTDRMTATVVDVLPNGNMVIEGFRARIISGEERIMRISGIVRPADVAVNNVVESRFIAKFQIAYEGRGVDSRFVNQGWLGRVMNRLWPY